MAKAPSFQFYPGDWRRDLNLQSCSIGARGLWIELLCLMHEAVPYGHLLINGVSPDDASVSRLVHLDLKSYRRLLDELTRKGVARSDENGILYSKRMVEDQRLRDIRRMCGKMGGNPILVNQIDNQPSNQNTTPSSSSSSSSSFSNKNHRSVFPKSPEIARLREVFSGLCLENEGFIPQFSEVKEDRRLRTLLERFSEEDLHNLFKWFFEYGPADKLTPDLAVVCSSSVVNEWLASWAGPQEVKR